jgi:hypothetical protein
MRSQYAPPSNYGVPNPWGPREHNWSGGPLDEGSLYHGPIYTRPVYGLPRIQNPVFGTPQGLGLPADEIPSVLTLVGGCLLLLVAEHYVLNQVFGKRR